MTAARLLAFALVMSLPIAAGCGGGGGSGEDDAGGDAAPSDGGSGDGAMDGGGPAEAGTEAGTDAGAMDGGVDAAMDAGDGDAGAMDAGDGDAGDVDGGIDDGGGVDAMGCGDCDDGNACTEDVCTDTGCVSTCIEPPHVVDYDCDACTVTTCAEGFEDDNGDATDGCEVDLDAVYVDASNTDDPDEDGTMSHPFDRIDEGLAAVSPDHTVVVAAGSYDGGNVVSTPGVTVRGAGADSVTVAVADGETGFEITASRVTIEGLEVEGGRYGVHFDGSAGRLSSGTVREAEVRGQRGTADEEVAGVRAVDMDDVEIEALVVDDIAGGPGMDASSGDGGAGGDAAGLRLDDLSDCTVDDVVISNVVGGTGGDGWGSIIVGGMGGLGVGVHATDVSRCPITNVLVTDVTGGVGGYGEGSLADGGTGGTGAGFYLDGPSGPSIEHVAVLRATGGDGGEGYGSSAEGGTGGIGAGLVVADGGNALLNHGTFVELRGGAPGPDGGAGSIPGEDGMGFGVGVLAGPSAPSSVSNTIVSRADSHCAWNDPDNAASDLAISYSLVHTCGGADTMNTSDTAIMTGDPELLDIAGDDVHVSSSSPAIDRGARTAECSTEPSPNGCRVNIGRYGNSEGATSAPGASHCAVCP